MVLLDWLILSIILVLFAWQVLVPLVRDRPIFPMFRNQPKRKVKP